MWMAGPLFPIALLPLLAFLAILQEPLHTARRPFAESAGGDPASYWRFGMSTEVTYQNPAAAPRRNWVWAVVLVIIAACVGIWAYQSTRPQPAQVVVRDIQG